MMGCYKYAPETDDQSQTDQVSSATNPVAKPEVSRLKLRPADYVAWMNQDENKVSSAEQLNGITYSFTFLPQELVALQHLRDTVRLRNQFTDELDAIKAYQYYTLSIATPTGQSILSYRADNESEREKRSEYYSFAMQRDIKLVEGTDTLACAMYHFENSFGVMPYTNLMIGFERRDTIADTYDKTLFFTDNVTGIQASIVLKAGQMASIPELIFN
jgi:hypothetical protein